MKARGTTIARLRRARAARRTSLSRHAGVLGSALGFKSVAGVATDEPAVVVLVRTKKPEARLADGARVPRHLRVAGRTVATDVVQLRSLKLQSGRYCFDGAHQGIVSGFARADGTTYGVTCAHCMQGPAGTELERVPMAIARPGGRGYDVVGASAYRIFGSGSGMAGDYGFMDAGLFELDPPHARRLVASTQPYRHADLRVGMAVRGQTGHGAVAGHVRLLEVEFGDVRVDVLVELTGRGTYGGDSGMMWVDAAGHAVGMHAMGSEEGPHGGSAWSAAMFAHRVEEYLGVDLLQP